jgi:hypothetical protein
MGFTQKQKEVHTYCDQHDFIPGEVVEQFTRELEADGNLQTLAFALEDFLEGSCKKCTTVGMFKWHFLGRLQHPACNYSWYVTPGTYVGEQLRRSIRAGMDMGADMHEDTKKKGEPGGWLVAILGFVVGTAFRLTFAIISIPAQLIFSLSQPKTHNVRNGKS